MTSMAEVMTLRHSDSNTLNRSTKYESVTAAAGAVDYHIDICPHNNIDIDFILL